MNAKVCGQFVSWWDGEYEGECELPEGHEGDHWDGMSWFNDDGENTDCDHLAAGSQNNQGDERT